MPRTGQLMLWISTLLLSACGDETRAGRSGAATGWSARLDDASAKDEAGRCTAVDGGLEVKPGSNATLWHADHRAEGSYRLSVHVTHLDSGLHPHGAGLTFGGTDVDGAGQAYTYFLVRGDGQFLIKTRKGEETADVTPWTAHDAVAPEGKDGVTENRLTVEVGATETRFLVNSIEVHSAPNASLSTDGRYGFRLVHDLHVRFGKPHLERAGS